MEKQYIDAYGYMKELHEKVSEILYDHEDLTVYQKDRLLLEFDRVLNPKKAVAQMVGIDGTAEEIVFGSQIEEHKYKLLIFEQ